VPISKANKMPPDQITYMVTGSQGEPSAVLSRLAVGRQPQLEVRKGDTVIISAHPIPGNEEMIQRTINKLIQKGADVVYDPIEQVHVSGHASQEEMKLMINMIQPRYFVPIHGELRHLHSHTRLAIQLGIPEENCAIVENGTIIEFAKDSMTIGDRYPGGYVFVDGRGVGDIGPAVMRDREILGSEGFVTIFAAVDRRGNMVKEPRIISRGFVYLRESEQLFVAIKDAIRRSLGKTSNGRRNEAVEEAVSRVIYQETKRRPMVFAHIHQEVAE
jgi:ribonuclease J